ncbi:MAG: phasin family protein [Variovorax sp.]
MTVAAPAKKAAPRKTAAAAKKATRTTKAAPAAKATAQPRKSGAQGLLRAGLKALDDVRNDVVKRQSNVIENLLGITPGKDGRPGNFGIRKFEDVFDQRVATALQRLGMPSADEIRELREQMRLLREHLERTESVRRKR